MIYSALQIYKFQILITHFVKILIKKFNFSKRKLKVMGLFG